MDNSKGIMGFLNDGNSENLYDILNVPFDATQEEIIHSYLLSKKIYSSSQPDIKNFFNDNELEQLLSLIDEAFYVLSDKDTRNQYDLQFQMSPSLRTKQNHITTSSHLDLMENKNIQSIDSNSSSKNEAPLSSRKSANPLIFSSNKQDIKTTKISQYLFDADFENRIQNQEIFDGTFLAKIRHYKAISLDQMSEETRITPSYLNAIESNDYDSLPAPVFVRSYIKNIAQILELDSEKVSRSYMSLFK